MNFAPSLAYPLLTDPGHSRNLGPAFWPSPVEGKKAGGWVSACSSSQGETLAQWNGWNRREGDRRGERGGERVGFGRARGEEGCRMGTMFMCVGVAKKGTKRGEWRVDCKRRKEGS